MSIRVSALDPSWTRALLIRYTLWFVLFVFDARVSLAGITKILIW